VLIIRAVYSHLRRVEMRHPAEIVPVNSDYRKAFDGFPGGNALQAAYLLLQPGLPVGNDCQRDLGRALLHWDLDQKSAVLAYIELPLLGNLE